VLSALRNIATLHGTAPATPEEIQLIEGVCIHIFEHPEETKAQENMHLKPDGLAAAVSEKYTEALGENMRNLEDFIGARQKHSKNMEYCALRKLGRDVFGTLDGETQKRVFDQLVAHAEVDPAKLDRYKALESYPKGSLGRAFSDFYAQFDWPLARGPVVDLGRTNRSSRLVSSLLSAPSSHIKM